ncbi:MAG: hypothetical protein VYE22_33075 [Myxococcota bacterium]|nr:hypothetical protein [Myxococcota bacterium]
MRLAFLSPLVLAVACTNPAPGDSIPDRVVRDSACTGLPIGLADGQLVRAFTRPGVRPFCVDATSCEAYLACEGIDLSRSCDFPDDVTCDGGVLQMCSRTGALVRRPCEEANPVCTIGEAGFPHCTTGETCEGEGSRCVDEGRLDRCVDGHLERSICPEASVCVDVEGGAVCADQAAPCEASRCDGTRLERCVGGGAITLRECADLPGGGTCEEVDGGARCVPTETVCETGELRCEGAVARVCTDGVWVDFDCGAFDAACVEMEDGLRCVG